MLDPLETEKPSSDRPPQVQPTCKPAYTFIAFLLFSCIFALICMISLSHSESEEYIVIAHKEILHGDQEKADASSTEPPKPEEPLKPEIETVKPEIPEVLYEDDLPWLFDGRSDPELPSRETYRLPEWIHSLSYVVNLTVQIKRVNGAEQSTFEGIALLKFRVDGQASAALEFHVGDYALHTKSLTTRDGRSLRILSTSSNWRKETVTLQLDQSLQAGEEYALSLTWRGVARYDDQGLYEMWHTDRAGTHHYALGTQGEPTGTRLWMPCFDEPAMKAVLHLSVEHPSSFTARSNMQVIEKQELSDKSNVSRTTFHPTPLMSTYLFALSVTNYVEKRWEYQGIPLSVVLPPRIAKDVDKIIELANNSVHQFMTSLKAPIIFDKIDFVFFPDSSQAAMENVGHISAAQEVAHVFSLYVHEMMHNYFGNLVTLSWWDEVWLNEGLTSLYEEELSLSQEELSKNLRRVKDNVMIEYDSTRKTNSLTVQATDSVSAMNSIEPKVYTKGMIVLYMMKRLLGDKAWKEGIEEYLNKFAFKSVNGEDFLGTMSEAARKYHDEEVVEFAKNMTRDFLGKMGFPLLRVSQVGKTLTLSQQRFHTGFINGSQKEDKEEWRLPVYLMKLDGTPYKTIFMKTKNMKVNLDTDETLILKTDEVVYYRTVYNTRTYTEILKSDMADQVMKEIMLDLLRAACSGYVDVDFAFTILLKDKILPMILHDVSTAIQRMFLFEPSTKNQLISLLHGVDRNVTDYMQKPLLTPNHYCKRANEDAVWNQYHRTRNDMAFFCEQVYNSWSASGYRQLVDRILAGNESALFHEGDVSRFFARLGHYKPNLVAQALLDMARASGDENEIASMIRRAAGGLTELNTKELRDIAEISPWAARQNKDLYFRLFGRRHSHESESRVLGEQIAKTIEREMAKKKPADGKMAKSGRKSLKRILNSLQFAPKEKILIM